MKPATEPFEPTWYDVELPLLRHIVAQSEADRPRLSIGQISSEIRTGHGSPGLDLRIVEPALRRLERDGLVTIAWAARYSGEESMVIDFDARAYGLIGMWPSPEAGAQQLITVLEQIAANTDSKDTRTRAEKIKKLLTGSGQQLAVTIAAAFITRGIQ